ncbi:hypothetical protein VMCG_04528 [Cytospora schulzeri]|uniref:Uncharacterized protein n=1 Tax=Cytospora schulzeri TaxID=448051 RepID=A0A423WRX1_9PEZI|nr:hypothetical protein VMCG_04528 [Valsa malicola]
MSHFSDEFITYAKEEDAVNHQHSSNWIPCYVLITIIPFVFIGCAWWSNRQKKAAKPINKRRSRTCDHSQEDDSGDDGDDDDDNDEPGDDGVARNGEDWAREGEDGTSEVESGGGGDDAFEDVDLTEEGSSRSRWLRGGGRLTDHHHPVPNWLRKTALPGESSAFQFQSVGSDWPRYENLVLVQMESSS